MIQNITLEQIIEALLFAYGESMSFKKIVQALGKTSEQTEAALLNLQKNLAGRGVKLINLNNNWQLVSHAQASKYIEKLVKSELKEELTPAGLEVMAIVAYKNGAGRADIESIRGVNSSYTLRNLMLRGLVERIKISNNQISYHLSLAVLRKLGLEKMEDLPRFREFQRELIKSEELLNQKA